METRGQGERMSPIDHLDAMADRLSKAAADVKKIADAAKPLYASLDETSEAQFCDARPDADARARPVCRRDDGASTGGPEMPE